MENRMLFPTEAGTPQGGIISPTLANLTLDGLEQLLKMTFRQRKSDGKSYNPKVNFVRYADDFIITASSKELLENEVKPLVERFLFERGLQLSPEKTCITHIEEGFDFLGQNRGDMAASSSLHLRRRICTRSSKRCAVIFARMRRETGELDQAGSTRSSGDGRTITATSLRVRRSEKRRWSSGSRSGDGRSVGTRRSPLPGS